MPLCVYALKTRGTQTYIGQTCDLRRRFKEHHSGAPSKARHYTNRTSNKGIPWFVAVVVRGFLTNEQIRIAERIFKRNTRAAMQRFKQNTTQNSTHPDAICLRSRFVAFVTAMIATASRLHQTRPSKFKSSQHYVVTICRDVRPFVITRLAQKFPTVDLRTLTASFDRGPHWCGVVRRSMPSSVWQRRVKKRQLRLAQQRKAHKRNKKMKTCLAAVL